PPPPPPPPPPPSPPPSTHLRCSFGEPYYVNIFTHILIMMYRNTHGNALSREEDQTRQYDENIFNVASQMIHKIEQRIAHTLP
ncbi:PRD domain-containing protein, partial [Escherichia coli]|uniref:PRD domain-containing protein n=1 Tax=Escherichia coli TaxID=562 RepID=UPI0021189233